MEKINTKSIQTMQSLEINEITVNAVELLIYKLKKLDYVLFKHEVCAVTIKGAQRFCQCNTKIRIEPHADKQVMFF